MSLLAILACYAIAFLGGLLLALGDEDFDWGDRFICAAFTAIIFGTLLWLIVWSSELL